MQQTGIVTATAADTEQKDALQQHADICREIPKIHSSFSPLAQVYHQPLQPGLLVLFILMDEDD